MLLVSNWIREVIDIYWGQNLQTIQTFLFAKLGEEVVC